MRKKTSEGDAALIRALQDFIEKVTTDQLWQQRRPAALGATAIKLHRHVIPMLLGLVATLPIATLSDMLLPCRTCCCLIITAAWAHYPISHVV
ncbi:hypothetical protein GUJ93_ZPchr0007g6337 [Zizania palustris]|uniref:Uncharacterized protein n=1 Tax=Zizania palustris TaxID=103762 RepID=A0A8J5W4P3_ZIZPA|nr:hypothetical protein GUJ93_ZPchr0007g6337 [Zizania palustris]